MLNWLFSDINENIVLKLPFGNKRKHLRITVFIGPHLNITYFMYSSNKIPEAGILAPHPVEAQFPWAQNKEVLSSFELLTPNQVFVKFAQKTHIK